MLKMKNSGENAASENADFGDKMGFLGHNFGSRHARRSSKGSIDVGDHLVFKKKNSLFNVIVQKCYKRTKKIIFLF